MSSSSRLTGRTALVTGGAVRLGRAIALRLAQEGADVAIQYATSANAAQEVVRKIESLGRRCVAISADFTADPAAAAERAIREASAALGPVDLLVNSAAVFEPGTLADLTEAAWDKHFDINLKAPLWLTRAFAGLLPTDRTGCVINMVDWRALRPPTGHLAYTLTKAALAAATQLLAKELAPQIRVNAVAPGAILPPPGADESYLKQLRQRIPLARTGHPDDVTDAVVYLASASFVTGEILTVTGGEQL